MAVHFFAERNLPKRAKCRNARSGVLSCEHAKRPCPRRGRRYRWLRKGKTPRGLGSFQGPGGWPRPATAATIRPTPPCEAKLAKEPALPKDIASLSFEDALKELEGIVQQLERGQVKLDEAISAYERGALLKKHCEQKLAEAKMKVEKIVFSADGSIGSQPADLN
ncbi:MAG: exodeoxyribonuclease VII small subunit [Alphaproteobacteria bacterium]|nr:exodeoxyribonuclease VII small subunit [Alphaproteobacteria bacterium]